MKIPFIKRKFDLNFLFLHKFFGVVNDEMRKHDDLVQISDTDEIDKSQNKIARMHFDLLEERYGQEFKSLFLEANNTQELDRLVSFLTILLDDVSLLTLIKSKESEHPTNLIEQAKGIDSAINELEKIRTTLKIMNDKGLLFDRKIMNS